MNGPVRLLCGLATVLLAAVAAWPEQSSAPPAAGDDTGIAAPDAGMVRIRDFAIDRYEFPNRRGVLPRVMVSWHEARALCQARGKRLCAGHEWRLAAGGAENLLYGYGVDFENGRCNTPFFSQGMWRRDRGPVPAGHFQDCCSPYGVHDMIGNVWEWTAGTSALNPDWRIVRGGSWFHNVNMARVDSRYSRFLTPDYRLDLIGFRCCKDVE